MRTILLTLAVCKHVFPLCYSDTHSTFANHLLYSDTKVPVPAVIKCKCSVTCVYELIFLFYNSRSREYKQGKGTRRAACISTRNPHLTLLNCEYISVIYHLYDTLVHVTFYVVHQSGSSNGHIIPLHLYNNTHCNLMIFSFQWIKKLTI